MAYYIGLDLGSTCIKIVLLNGHKIIFQQAAPTAPGQEELGLGLIAGALAVTQLDISQIKGIACTGYGQNLFTNATQRIDEITANALGLHYLSQGRARTIINIGGQDLKMICLSSQGQVTDFKMNDKCAAGTGRFFEVAARILDTPLAQFAFLSQAAQTDLEISQTCVVFAETEMVSLLARGSKKEDIIKALHRSVAQRTIRLAGFDAFTEDIFLDGGPAQNKGLARAIEEELMMKIHILPEPQYTVAYGAALSLISR